MSEVGQASGRVALSRDFSALLVELSIALHKHAMYPTGHPSLEPAASSVARRAARLLEDRSLIAIGIARKQLIIEGVATDPAQPVLRRLAEALHRHHLGALSLARGVQPAEISAALRALSADPDRDGALGLTPANRRPDWAHLRLHPLTFDRLALVAPAPEPGTPPSDAARRGAELWIGLARAALAGERTGGEAAAVDPAAAVPIEPAVVARAIDEHPRAEAYDQVIVGYLLQIATELRDANGAETAALRRRTARLISALHPDTLRRLVHMGGNVAQRRAFVVDAAHGMAVDAVLEIVRAAGDVTGQTISDGLVRMLTKLAAHAELGSEQARPLADTALREQVAHLLSGWQLADPASEAYGRLLQRITTMDSGSASRHADSRDGIAEALRVVQMSLEAGAAGPLVDRAVDRAVADGGVTALLPLLAAPPVQARGAAEAILARLLRPETLRVVLAREPLDAGSLDQLLPLLPVSAWDLVLEALSAAESRATRRKLLDRLASAPVDIGPLVVARLADERWFVQRNLLMLLERAGCAPPGFSARKWAVHPDARVRHQAIRLQLTLPAERLAALRTALSDGDPRLIRIGLAALRRECPDVLADAVIGIAGNYTLDEDLRLLAVRALGICPAPQACAVLVRMVDGGRTLLGRQKLAPRTPLMLAALKALQEGWSADPQAARMLAVAASSDDADIRRAGGAALPVAGRHATPGSAVVPRGPRSNKPQTMVDGRQPAS